MLLDDPQLQQQQQQQVYGSKNQETNLPEDTSSPNCLSKGNSGFKKEEDYLSSSEPMASNLKRDYDDDSMDCGGGKIMGGKTRIKTEIRDEVDDAGELKTEVKMEPMSPKNETSEFFKTFIFEILL